uniref:Adenylate kinase n=1 Tax=Palpitomonas bilix TaxID=652834 RepID=A0A7S3DEP6_9EUKA|mmetsp:Transcript_34540/g.89510  ORF Transcript_34540/g.89510 Transcript_34540/m.89510 type:complete len:222 (+) Transcript_34540:1377-2042(+)
MRAHGFEQLRSVIVDKLQAGQELSDVDITACLKAATSSEEVGSRGFVLDGWPRTEAQAILLEEAGIVPSTVVEISTSDATCRARGPIDVEPQLDSYHRSNSKSTPSSFYRRLRGNVVTVDGEQSRWAVYAAAERSVMVRRTGALNEEWEWTDDACLFVVQATQQAESHYRQRISAGQPAKLSTLGGVISLDSFRRGLSAEFGGYCPVSFKGWMKMVVVSRV